MDIYESSVYIGDTWNGYSTTLGLYSTEELAIEAGERYKANDEEFEYEDYEYSVKRYSLDVDDWKIPEPEIEITPEMLKAWLEASRR